MGEEGEEADSESFAKLSGSSLFEGGSPVDLSSISIVVGTLWKDLDGGEMAVLEGLQKGWFMRFAIKESMASSRRLRRLSWRGKRKQ